MKLCVGEAVKILDFYVISIAKNKSYYEYLTTSFTTENGTIFFTECIDIIEFTC